MDPVAAVWINLAITLAGVLIMLGAKRQQITDNTRRLESCEECIDELKDGKLSVDDYRREYREVKEYIGDVDSRAATNTNEVRGRVQRLEERALGAGGHRR